MSYMIRVSWPLLLYNNINMVHKHPYACTHIPKLIIDKTMYRTKQIKECIISTKNFTLHQYHCSGFACGVVLSPPTAYSNHLFLLFPPPIRWYLVGMWHACDSNSKKCQAAAHSGVLLFQEDRAQTESFLTKRQSKSDKQNHQTRVLQWQSQDFADGVLNKKCAR